MRGFDAGGGLRRPSTAGGPSEVVEIVGPLPPEYRAPARSAVLRGATLWCHLTSRCTLVVGSGGLLARTQRMLGVAPGEIPPTSMVLWPETAVAAAPLLGRAPVRLVDRSRATSVESVGMSGGSPHLHPEAMPGPLELLRVGRRGFRVILGPALEVSVTRQGMRGAAWFLRATGGLPSECRP